MGTLRFLKKCKKETFTERRIPKLIGRGYNRPKSVDAVTLGLQHQMSNLSISANGYKMTKRPVSSTPSMFSSKSRTSSSKSSTSYDTLDEVSSVASSDPNDLENSDTSCPTRASNVSETPTEASSESDDSRGIGRRVIGECYPRFNINTRNTSKFFKKENLAIPKDSCGFLRCIMSDLEQKEQAEELARRKARRNATFNKEQARQIDRENQILLQKLLRVERQGKRIQTESTPNILCNRKRERDKEARRIKRENARLYMKIKFARPSQDLMHISELG